jgi:hypothetical protein
MNLLATYLEKFRKIIGDSSEKKKIISDAVSLLLDSPLAVEAITIKDNTIYISSTPAQKSELFIYGKQIRDELEKKFNHKVIIK